ncbi:MAG: glycoside hydrolase family 3 N-terminal domain-containing protein [Anaerolineae bacterium]|nr:glycoside hydrolase family 3 C-terminal domain-containing protein [Thermoflexales bacterium]MDW8407641.1 glycoside hydrolase family 3 N-terminal domain-containing protein [Anaerolineae bacterium]
MNTSNPLSHPQVEQRVNELLARMTLEEKVGQMNQELPLAPPQLDAVRAGRIGSFITEVSALAGAGVDPSPAVRAEICNDLQRVAVTESRLGIPLLFGRDVIHGYRTIFPIPLGMAATWNPERVEQAASVAAMEAAAAGIKWTFAPMLDIARDPRWGRIAEGPGEDPFLGSALARAMVRGFQGDNLSRPDKLAACAKHYAGYGAAEGGRDYNFVDISMRTLRDVYLPPFRAAVDAGAATLMSGFHDYSGVPVAANRTLLTDVLREEWGFQGFVVSDWNAVHELVVHGIAADDGDAAVKATTAGVDMDMIAGAYVNQLAQQVRSGRLSIDVVDQAVRRILRVKLAAGLFDHPYTDPQRAARVILTPDHRALARQLAHESCVLLKNENNLLPLRPEGPFKRIAVFGPFAQARGELFGTWTLDGRAEDVTSIADALRETAPTPFEILCLSDKPDESLYHTLMGVDLAVLVVGEHPRRSGEAASVSNLELPAGQRQMIESIHDAGVPIVLIVLAGRPLAIKREVDLAHAVLYAWHPGVEGGYAVADLLFGRAVPSGRLPVTMPRATGQVPIYYNHRNTGRPAANRGDSSRYIDLPIGPLFPFGFGLSYTTFRYSDMRIVQNGRTVHISAQVTNTGAIAAVETAQLYVRDVVASLTRPVKELKGFCKLFLQPGETQTAHFTLSEEDLTFTGLDDRPVFEPGVFHVWVGAHSASGLQGTFEL